LTLTSTLNKMYILLHWWEVTYAQCLNSACSVLGVMYNHDVVHGKVLFMCTISFSDAQLSHVL